MPEVEGVEKLLSVVPRKRLGRHRCYGRGMYAFSVYGEDEIVLETNDGSNIELSGIYRTDNVSGKTKYYREPYYTPKNPRSVNQQAQRTKFADAVSAWQSLTPEQKQSYNNKAEGLNMSGYNLFLREYLLSH